MMMVGGGRRAKEKTKETQDRKVGETEGGPHHFVNALDTDECQADGHFILGTVAQILIHLGIGDR